MGNNDYLIPANSKKSMLILGMFDSTDLIIAGTGFIITLILSGEPNRFARFNNSMIIYCII